MRCEPCPLELVEARARARVAVLVHTEYRLEVDNQKNRTNLEIVYRHYARTVEAMSAYRAEATKRGCLPDLHADDRALDQFIVALTTGPAAVVEQLAASVLEEARS